MKKYFIFIAALLLLNSCLVLNTGKYSVGLSDVEPPRVIKNKTGKASINLVKDSGSDLYQYEDSLINIYWNYTSKSFNFSLINKTESTIKLIWDDAVYVNVDGSSNKVFHSGIKYNERSNAQVPSVIMKGQRLDDLVMPSDNVKFISTQYASSWVENSLFIDSGFFNDEDLKKFSSQYIGKTVKVLLPLKIEDKTYEYIFTFKVEDFKIINDINPKELPIR